MLYKYKHINKSSINKNHKKMAGGVILFFQQITKNQVQIMIIFVESG